MCAFSFNPGFAHQDSVLKNKIKTFYAYKVFKLSKFKLKYAIFGTHIQVCHYLSEKKTKCNTRMSASI